ncbi:hypothetical protein [Acinetobacter tianfuensis]|uniref:Uncharacterized protein n=1 Tax=Acinetobacter tianfuensis TaxID=2419603 RepID=A0A3A8E561_9GAMM|nr:hypothetical protein [Acinetobacter tianfuensis]RKG29289.1 hypothetical protein D7V32_15580 [Acinetobacter tianfuensis]
MKLLKTAVGLALLLTSPVLLAQAAETEQQAAQQNQKLIQPYGKNPNIFHVWAYKAQEGVVGAAKNVGDLTERGVSKVKPSVDQAWDNTKNLASTTVHKVDEGATQAAQNANTKIQETKEALGAKPQQPVPIEQQSLSSPTLNNSNSTNSSQAPAASSGSSTTTAYPVTDL